MILTPDFYKLDASDFHRSDAQAFTCRLAKHDWAVLLLHEPSGTVAIHSSYGDWVYSWPRPGRGDRTLAEFVCRGSYDYMAEKFTAGHPETFDAEKTKKSFTDCLLDGRRLGEIGADEARTVYDDIRDAEEGGVEAFYDSLLEETKEWMGVDWYEVISYDRDQEFYWLRDGVLPALVAELRKTMPAEKAAA